MKKHIKSILFMLLLLLLVILWMTSCNSETMPKPLVLQKPKTYDNQYYANLRAYKKTKHQILFVGFSDYFQEISMGTRFMGLPDSVDIISLWSGIPLENENKKVYDEMRFVQKMKGTRVVGVSRVGLPEKYAKDDVGIKQYGDEILNDVKRFGLDGWDFNNAPDEKEFLTGENFYTLLKYVGQAIGPQGADPHKLLIVDGNSFPPNAEPYISYFVKQAYGIRSSQQLQGEVEDESAYLPLEKLVLTMSMEDDWKTGGLPWMDASAESKGMDGMPMSQMEGFACWNPKKGGCGLFTVQHDYNSNPPYKYTRRAIQIMNPAVK